MNDTPSTLSVPIEDLKRTSGACTLVVVSDSGTSQLVMEPERPICIGRSRSSDVVIDHPSASRCHAVFHPGDPPEIEDLGSSNGTWVQGQRIPTAVRVPVPPGTGVVIAGVSLFVRNPGADTSSGRAEPRPSLPVAGGVRSVALRDEKMQELLQVVTRLGASNVPVLVLGETGVGKEMLAERLHQLSPRRERPLLRVNCASLSEGVLASELFGHERGAFTGAHATKIGLFEAAHGGTVFLDEVGELPLETQAKLLRVLESGEVIRVGSHQARQVDVRVVSATNRDLRVLVSESRFRADLYYRLNGVVLEVPPLRDRPSDILPLAEFFIARATQRMALAAPSLSDGARQALLAHSYPGNVRELKHVIERAVVLSQGPVLDVASLHFEPALPTPRHHVSADSERGSVRPTDAPRSYESALDRRERSTGSNSRLRSAKKADQLRVELAKAERDRIVEALQRAGNQADAARLLGISRRALLYRLDAYGIARPRKGRNRADDES
jgi:two-component system response regulator AtoC